jgi:hypothetical protein
LKLGWTKFWLYVSLASIISGPSIAATPVRAGAAPARATQGNVTRANETLLAGLRPGRDTVAMAEKRFKSKKLADSKDAENKEWRDDCSGRAIRLELNAQAVIQSITITSLAAKEGACGSQRPDFLDAKNWVTGRGLRLGDSQDRVVSFYGEPNSSGPASKNGQDLDLMYYQFDWAGSDVPQVMEILCTRDSGRVVEITLAFPSL